jgi:hypothetical protein
LYKTNKPQKANENHNQFVEKRKIKFEGSKEALNYAKKGKFMVKFDLRSGYHHVDINFE